MHSRFSRLLLYLAAAGLPAADPFRVQLQPQTLKAFDEYVKVREAGIERDRLNGKAFLKADESAARRKTLRAKGVLIEPHAGDGLTAAPSGLIHDWYGAAFFPKATLPQVQALVRDYDNHKNVYQPEVVDSKLLSRDGDRLKIFLKLRKQQIITVVLNTEYEVFYARLDPKRIHSRSYSTRITEVEKAGTPEEKELPPGDDHGFLWRLYSYWRFQERDGGVYAECEAISLTRDVPLGLGPILRPIIRNLPRESLEKSLLTTRAALGGSRF